MLIGKYRVEGVLGAGGMGVVLAATHLVLHERVALKVLGTGAGRPARILREARAAAKLRGPHVARVLDAGLLDDGGPFVAYEHLEGRDFRSLELPLLPSEAANLALQLCEALAEAHRSGIVHRDIKPSNLFLAKGADGRRSLKLLDFGLAKFLDEPMPDLSASQAVLGSPRYMAPEQIRSPRNVDARADIWALGVLLWEWVSGQRPFLGESSSAILAAILTDPPPSLTERAPETPIALQRLIGRCLIKDQSDRIQDVAELADGLAPFTSDGPLRAARVRRILKTEALRLPLTSSAEATLDPYSQGEDFADFIGDPLSASGGEPRVPELSTTPSSRDSITTATTTEVIAAPSRVPVRRWWVVGGALAATILLALAALWPSRGSLVARSTTSQGLKTDVTESAAVNAAAPSRLGPSEDPAMPSLGGSVSSVSTAVEATPSPLMPARSTRLRRPTVEPTPAAQPRPDPTYEGRHW